MTELPYQRAFHRIRAEFFATTGLRLTAERLEGLTGVDRTICTAALEDLVRAGFLDTLADGTYARRALASTAGVYRSARGIPPEPDASQGPQPT